MRRASRRVLTLFCATACQCIVVTGSALAPPSTRSPEAFLERFRAPAIAVDAEVDCVVSHVEACALHALKKTKTKELSAVAEVSLDLGLRSAAQVWLREDGVALDASSAVFFDWPALAKIARKKKTLKGCWSCRAGLEPEKVSEFSEVTGRAASLLPLDTPGALPTAILGGFNMHRIKGLEPAEDTLRKVVAAHGRVLDVCTGLGYTAIAAARKAGVTEVVTIELDPAMVRLQRANPWSNALFAEDDGEAKEDDAPEKEKEKKKKKQQQQPPIIRRLLGDAAAILPQIPDGRFDAVVHDPPTAAMAGDLFSFEVYAQLRRVLRPGGTLFHYIGDPASKASGRMFQGVAARLRDAGFTDVETDAQSFGIRARAA